MYSSKLIEHLPLLKRDPGLQFFFKFPMLQKKKTTKKQSKTRAARFAKFRGNEWMYEKISLKDLFEWEVNLFSLSVILIALMRAKRIWQTIRLVANLKLDKVSRTFPFLLW